MGLPMGWTNPEAEPVERPWPALPGQEQHDWEPPRVGKNIPNRAKRLKALGNAVVPQVAEIIGKAIIKAEGEFNDTIHNPSTSTTKTTTKEG